MKRKELKEVVKAAVAEQKAAKAKQATMKPASSKAKETTEQEKDFLKALVRRDYSALRDQSQKQAQAYSEKGQVVGTNADGGFLVPETLEVDIVRRLDEVSSLRGVATVVTMDSPDYKLNIEGTEPTSYWVSEEAAITESKQTFSQVEIVAHKLAALGGFSSESLEDAVSNPSLRQFVVNQFAKSLARLENDAFVNGNGTGKPFGFRTMTPGSTAALTANITSNNIVDMYYRLDEDYRDTAAFMFNDDARKLVHKLKDLNGRYIWTNGGGIEAASPTLISRPVNSNKAIPSNVGTATDATEMWFGDWSYYMIGDYRGLRIDFGTNADDFAKDRISLRLTKRVGGKTLLPEAFTRLTDVKDF